MTWDLPGGEPVTLDPFGEYSVTVTQNMCETLQYRDPKSGRLIPGLAQKTSYPDDRTAVFDLQPDARFWNGDPVTAEDVVFSLQRSKGDVKSYFPGFFAIYWTNVSSITATGPRQVTVKFSKPNYQFRQETALQVVTAVLQKKYYLEQGQKYGTPTGGLMCSGPFKLQKWAPGQSISLVPNTSYWDRARTPKIAKLTFRFLTDNAAITSGLRSGALDGSMALPASTVSTLQRASNGKLLSSDGPETRIILPFGGSLESAAMRRALSLTIDRVGMARVVFAGAAQPQSAMYPPWSFSYARGTFQAGNAAVPGVKPDLAAAKAAFQQAGSPKTPVRLGVNGSDQTAVRAATLIQSGARQIGMDVRIVAVPATRYQTLYSSKSARAGMDGALLFMTYAVPDPNEETSYWWDPKSATNFIGYDNPAVTRALADNTSIADPEQRAKVLVDAQAQAIERDATVITVANLKPLSFVSNRIGGYTSSWYNRFYPWATDLGASGQ